jgi:hypothetical protein
MLKVLFLSASPTGKVPLAIDEEVRAIDAKMRGAEHRDHLQLVPHGAVRIDDQSGLLMRELPGIVHFSTHGLPSGEIILLGADGRSKPVHPSHLAEVFRVLKGDVRVVVLNACYSAAQARGIVESIDCAVGIKGEIGDEASIAFSAEFYQALAYGQSVQQSYDLGMARLCSEGIAAPAARVTLDRREGVDPSQIILAPLGDAYFHRAQGYIGTAHYEQAIPELNHAIRLDPNSPRYFHYRGWGFLGLGYYKQCKTDFARAHALDPMNFPIPRVVFTVRFRVFLLMEYLFDPWRRRPESP